MEETSMPAKDKYHDVVVRALEKEGWGVASQSYLRVGKRVVWVDLKAKRSDGKFLYNDRNQRVRKYGLAR
jgi:hypothetical protein